MERLQERIAIVTGGASGIGLAVVKKLMKEGVRVICCDINEEALQQLQFDQCLSKEIISFKLDISDAEQIKLVVDEVIERFGRIDILVNNAGITNDASFNKMTEEQFIKVIDVNLNGTYMVSKSVVPHMIEQKYGKIVNLSSVSAFNGNFGQANYAASKAAIVGMTRVLGKELGRYGINVNAVSPGSILTSMYDAVSDDFRQKKLSAIPLRRFGEAEEVANLIAFLVSDEANYITAQNIVIDGGFN